MNIVDPVFAQSAGHSVALICGEQTVTYRHLEESVNLAAEELSRAGMPRPVAGRVPRIGLACPNGVQHVVLALAILRAGGCLVPIAGELSPLERATVIHTVGLDAVILADAMPWPELMQETGVKPCALPELAATLFVKINAPAHSFQETSFAALNPAFIRFSSGTTGHAKGVVLSHETLLARVETANRRLQISPEDRVVWILPMAHHFAVSIILYLLKGAVTIIADSHMAEDVLDAGRRHHGTVLYGAPFHHSLLAAENSGLAWPALRLAVSTAAALSFNTAKAFDARFRVPLAQGLGVIEVGLPLLNTTATREKPLSVGAPLNGVEVELRAPESGHLVSPGECGEVFVKAAGLLDAYLNPWQPRAFAAPGDWFCTGDLASRDSDGHLYLLGRTKSVINVGGMKCFPEEVEAVLESHPNIRAARVFGREHALFGMVPVAEIVLKTGEPPPRVSSLNAHCRAALSGYKVPLEFRFVESFPRTASGKVVRIR